MLFTANWLADMGSPVIFTLDSEHKALQKKSLKIV